MISVFASSVIDAPVEEVWKIVGDFGSIGDWLPGVVSCHIQEGGAPDRIGSVRLLDMGEIGTLHEKLLALSETEHTVTFAIVESPLPIQDYRSTIRLLPVTDGGKSYISWAGEFEATPEHAGEMRTRMPRDVYQPAFDTLKRRFAASA